MSLINNKCSKFGSRGLAVNTTLGVAEAKGIVDSLDRT